MTAQVDVRVLRALPSNQMGHGWPTTGQIAGRMFLRDDDAALARSVLYRLRGRGLVEQDGERPAGWARTAQGDVLLEMEA